MKKYLLSLCGISMLAILAACSNSNHNSSEPESTITVEATEAQTTTIATTIVTTTQKATTTKATTKKATTTKTSDKRKYSLEETHTVGDVSFKLPKKCNIKDSDDFEYFGSTITFPDLSILLITVCDDHVDIDSLSTYEIKELLLVCAESYTSNADWGDITKPEIIDIQGILAVKQESKSSDLGDNSIYDFFYNGNLYSFVFNKGIIEGELVSSSYDLQKEIIESFNFKESKTNANTDNKSDSSETLGQKNAVKSAKSYISHSAFSYLELIEQLEYEKYSHEEAVYAADNCGADWNAEALESAKSYISHSNFSYQSLFEQLEYEQFTSEQAQYGVDNCNADWFQEAADCAASYISHSSFSSEELFDQLLYEGFTQEQAEYGVQSVGY